MENDISASIDFNSSSTFSVPQFLTTQHDQFDLSSVQNQKLETDVDSKASPYPLNPSVVTLMGTQLPVLYEDEHVPSMPYYMSLDTSSPPRPFLDPIIGSYLSGNQNVMAGDLFLGTDLQPQVYQGENAGLFCHDPLPGLYNPSELQAPSDESEHHLNVGGPSTPVASEISSLNDSTLKAGKLSAEERKQKINRYMKKRNERNFSKKIKYACRKTLADSRPRVRGRFAKKDELGNTIRSTWNTYKEDTDEDVKFNQNPYRVAVKEETDMVDPLDIFAHISSIYSFNCNYPIQSWSPSTIMQEPISKI